MRRDLDRATAAVNPRFRRRSGAVRSQSSRDPTVLCCWGCSSAGSRPARSSGAGRVLDLGGGNGTLARLLTRHHLPTVVVDRAAYVRDAPRPAVQADAARLPFADGCFGAVAALWMLYYVPQPQVVLAESGRVLRDGGVFVACTSSRYNDPEFADVLPGWGEPFSFDAETAADMVAEQFSITEVLRWDTAAIRLVDAAAIQLFLRGRGLSESAAAKEAVRRRCLLTVTKRGCLIWARKVVT